MKRLRWVLSRYSWLNIKSYIVGNFRYKLYYPINGFYRFLSKYLLSIHIREQIGLRISSMDKQCYTMGNCKLCGCSTPALQMSNKSCDKPCYPKMLSKSDFTFLKGNNIILDRSTNKFWKIEGNKFKVVRSNNK